MATKSKGPKVEKVSKGGKAVKADDDKAEKRAAAKAEKEQAKAAKAEQKEAAKAEKAKQKEEAKAEKARKKETSKEEKAAKKQAKSEKTKAVKVAREGEEKKPAGKKKTIILIGVTVLLVLLIAVSIFFLVRMLRGGRDNTASLTPQSSDTPISVGTTEGSAPEGADDASGGEAPASKAESQGKPKDEKPEKGEKDEQDSEKAGQDQAQPDSSGGAASEGASEAPAGDGEALSAQAAKQAVEGSAGTAGVAAMLGSGAVPADQVEVTKNTPTDQPKPGQIVVGKEEETASKPETASSAPQKQAEKGTALTPPNKTQEVPDFKFSDESLNLPKFTYAASSALEAAVHRDIGEYLEQKDNRPGVQISSVVIGGQYNLPDGGVRVLAYAWGSRYAIADNTLFDYGSLVGPCALDYRGGALEKITLARPGDQFESSVRDFCGDRQDVADKMVNQEYDLELRGQMLRNVSNYIQSNNIPVIFFRASGQVYNRDGTIYLPPEIQEAETAEEKQAESEEGLQDSYKVIQEMPE